MSEADWKARKIVCLGDVLCIDISKEEKRICLKGI